MLFCMLLHDGIARWVISGQARVNRFRAFDRFSFGVECLMGFLSFASLKQHQEHGRYHSIPNGAERESLFSITRILINH